MRILLTGASGFIGYHVVSALGGHDVVAVTRAPLALHDAPHVSPVTAELHDEHALRSALEGCDAVLHLAAISNANVAAADPVACVDVNVSATARLARLAADAGVGRFVFTSSGLVYGNPSVLPITEDTPPNPASVYGVSKLVAEGFLQHLHPGALTLRVFNVFGPGQRGTLVPALIERLTAGGTITLQGDGSQVRSFLYVSDATEALRRAVESDHTGTLNLAGERASILDVVTAVAHSLGKPVEPSFGPARPGDPQENWASTDATLQALQWAPTTALQDGIDLTVAAG